MVQEVKGNQSILQKKKKILITSALPYVNNVPHLGNIIGCVLSADVFSRFCKSYGAETLYVCGTDEHGTTTEQKAIEENLSPKEVCDKYFAIHKDIYEWFNCQFDSFGRTSSLVNHEVSKDIFTKLDENGFIVEQDTIQMYDKKAEKYLPDRFVEGTCPKCSYESARGDQCDQCGNLLNPEDLIDPKSTITGETPEQRTEKHLFIDLPKLAPELKVWIDKTAKKANWSQNAVTMTKGWLKTGLKPRGISRNLKWGVPIPKKGFEDNVFYSWFDAPIGYIGISKEDRNDWSDWWHNPGNVELYQFMGKDNIPFHTIMFPSFLIGSKDNYTLLHQISSTEYLNYEDGQFSKSRGVGVFGNDAKESGIPSDIWRYHLLVNRPETSDTHFSWQDFQEKNNNELLANLGNFVNRTTTFIKNNFESTIPKADLKKEDKAFLKSVDTRIERITNLLSIISLKEALKEIMLLSKSGNQYFQEKQPWKTVKEEKTKQDAATTMFVCANLARKLAILLEPYIPQTSKEIFAMLNIEAQTWQQIPKDLENHQIAEPKILFRKYDDAEIEIWQKKYAGTQKERKMVPTHDFGITNLRVARIEDAEEHPDADKLFVLQISLGNEKRQLVAGLRGFYTADELKGKKIVIVANMKPAKLRGKESQGMLLAADDGENVKLLEPQKSEPGDHVYISKGEPASDKQITFEEFGKITIVTKDKKAFAYDQPLRTDVEEISVDIKDGSKVR
jgi:methionyl-tRNA synthetase